MERETSTKLFLVVFWLKICSIASLTTSSLDEFSLVSLKTSLNSELLSKNWSQETSFCTWIGVICSQGSPRVISLNISNMGLRGTIAREIGNLSFLTVLDMSNNNISGVIPREVGNLRRLRVLDLSSNKLSDHVPESLGLLRDIETLNLSSNQLSGDIPTSLSVCVKLKKLDISGNSLTGNIPIEFGNLSQLQDFVLWNNKLAGELPRTIFNISSLLTVDVGTNQMSGSIPQEICRQPAARNIQYLGLENNQFGGEIPPTLILCHSLQTLSLSQNKFTGTIPTGFWNLSAIQTVGLGGNGFTGTIPHSIANLSLLEVFEVNWNKFHGVIPPQIGQLSSLYRLALDGNLLLGEVPESLFNLSSLLIFSISSNNLSGVLPVSLGLGIPIIENLFLNDNMFTGKIPESICNLTGLQILDLYNNMFAGNLPINIGNLGRLQRLRLGFNHFTNNLSEPDQDFLSSLSNCNSLVTISIESNPITGILPISLGSRNLSESLQQLTAHSCSLTGPLPNEIGMLRNLVGLNLGYNYLTGAVPESLGYLTNLQKLDLYGNKLQGPVLHVLCKLEKLFHVDLRENSFYGQLPGCLGSLSKMTEINLAHNAFNSSIPSSFWSKEWITVNLSNNFFDGSLSQEIGNMTSLRELDLSGNQISGEIPTTFLNLQRLIHLSLSNNKMDGLINKSYAGLKNLEYLDLSGNNFSGPIPKSFEALVYLTYFNVSFNELSGEIPDGGPFVNFTAECFAGNKGLCGAPRFKVVACKSRHSRKNNHLKYLLPAVASGILFAALLIFLILRSRRRNLSTSSFDSFPYGVMHERISYYELLHATNNLDDKNLIGRGSIGSVYRGFFSDETVVAIKVFNLDVHDALKSFDTECQILCNLRHRNLVKVITCCSNLDFKALVMPYMPNGNLENYLHSSNNCPLSIFQRFGIMMDVASAMEYLHQGYMIPIAHCDLKPSNILLDDDMVAHVADFGIAKLLTQEQRIYQTTTLGTIGYMAPEYGSNGLISTMVDVYSYGILLMEVFSRRKPTDEMFAGELTMRRWVSESFTSSVLQIIDGDLLINMKDESTRSRHVGCLTSIIEVALNCTADLPEERPNMKDVVTTINTIMSNLSKKLQQIQSTQDGLGV